MRNVGEVLSANTLTAIISSVSTVYDNFSLSEILSVIKPEIDDELTQCLANAKAHGICPLDEDDIKRAYAFCAWLHAGFQRGVATYGVEVW